MGACHGCRSHQKTRERELFMISKGHIWLCYECKKEALILKKKNENWEGEVEHPREKDAEPIEEDDVEIIKDFAKHPEAKKGKLSENEGKTNKNKDKSSNSSVDSNASKIGDENVKGG